jgi:hypothetical protein
MSKRSNTRHTQANQPQELVPLTSEVAREIEKLLNKNAEKIENLMVRYKTGVDAGETRRRPRTAQV